MIGIWLLYATLLGALAALAASLLERVLGLWRRPVRLVWAAAMAVSLLAPLGVWLQPGAPAPAPTAALAAPGGVTTEAGTAAAATQDVLELVAARVEAAIGRAAARLAPLDRPLAIGWAVASMALIALFGRSALRLRRRRLEWARREVDGVEVLVAPDTGPAVVGGVRPGVVIPGWTLELDEPLRRLVLRHELEHLKAGDPRLLLAGVTAVVLAPWNLALWWQLGRLRLAVELDCDRRVLDAHGDVERYGLLLMAVGQRGSGLLRLATPALSEPATTLERRIDAMTARPPRRRRTVALTLAAGAALVAAAACEVPSPNRLSGVDENGVSDPVSTARSATDSVAPAMAYHGFQVEKYASLIPGSGTPKYPAQLREAGVPGQVIVQFEVDAEGAPDPATFRVLESSDSAFTLAVRTALPEMRFTPAEVGGKPVRQAVQLPFVFGVPPKGFSIITPLRKTQARPIQAGAASRSPLAKMP